jgi:hypothetical protein
LERVAQSLRAAGHSVRLLDLQIFKHRDYFRELDTWRPQAVGFSLNYLANCAILRMNGDNIGHLCDISEFLPTNGVAPGFCRSMGGGAENVFLLDGYGRVFFAVSFRSGT